jgi:D-alanyl-D-alanine carboxypeptidase
LLESGFNNSSLSWLTPSLGTVDQLKPIDAAPPNLRDEMCGGHRRKPASEDNDEEGETASGDGNPNYQLSALKPANEKFTLSSTPLISPEPIVVFTGPRNHPDTVEQTATAAAKKAHKKKTAAKTEASGEAKAETKKPAKKPAAKKEPKKDKSASASQ